MNRPASPAILLVFWLALASASVPAQERSHIVRAGESLAGIAQTYGVSPAALERANGLTAPLLPIGKRLVIPAAAAIMRAEPATPVAVARAEAVPPPAAEPAANEVADPPAESAPPIPPAATAGPGDFAAAIAIPAGENVRYNGRWVPPGESAAWVMDCSNTTRWLTREVRGIHLPRTASDQYEWLRARRRLWRIGPNEGALRRRLEPGDLLFWEDTYRPVRRPPVTHVMLYLGADARGRLMMAGSQGASGPDTYEFQPAKKMGGYRFFFFFRRDGKFVAYGRP